MKLQTLAQKKARLKDEKQQVKLELQELEKKLKSQHEIQSINISIRKVSVFFLFYSARLSSTLIRLNRDMKHTFHKNLHCYQIFIQHNFQRMPHYKDQRVRNWLITYII